jgi:hypothetical protein
MEFIEENWSHVPTFVFVLRQLSCVQAAINIGVHIYLDHATLQRGRFNVGTLNIYLQAVCRTRTVFRTSEKEYL